MTSEIRRSISSASHPLDFFAVERGLPVELQLEVLKRLDLPSLARFSGASRRYHQLGNDRAVWEALLKRMRLLSEPEQDLPVEELKNIAKFYKGFQTGILMNFTIQGSAIHPSCVCQRNESSRDLNGANSRFIASVVGLKEVRVSSRGDGRVWTVAYNKPVVCGIKLFGDQMAVFSYTDVHVWKIFASKPSHHLHLQPEMQTRATSQHRPIYAFDGRYVCIGLSKEIVQIDLAQKNVIRVGARDVTSLCLSGNDLYSGHSDGTIFRWDLSRHVRVGCVPKRHDSEVCALTMIGEDFLVSMAYGDFMLVGHVESHVTTLLNCMTFRPEGLHGEGRLIHYFNRQNGALSCLKLMPRNVGNRVGG